MGHSENRGRRGLTLPLSPRAKLIGLSILIAGVASLITSAQLDPIMAQVERVIDGDTIRVRHQGNSYTVRLIGEGYAHAYRLFPFSKRQEFIQLEEQARRRGIGLWNRR